MRSFGRAFERGEQENDGRLVHMVWVFTDWNCGQAQQWFFEGTNMKKGARVLISSSGREIMDRRSEASRTLVVLRKVRSTVRRRQKRPGQYADPVVVQRDRQGNLGRCPRLLVECPALDAAGVSKPAAQGIRNARDGRIQRIREILDRMIKLPINREAGRSEDGSNETRGCGCCPFCSGLVSERAERLNLSRDPKDEGGKTIPWSGPPRKRTTM